MRETQCEKISCFCTDVRIILFDRNVSVAADKGEYERFPTCLMEEGWCMMSTGALQSGVRPGGSGNFGPSRDVIEQHEGGSC